MADDPPPLRIGAGPRGERRLWFGYAGLCVLCWVLYAIASTEWLRGAWRLWEAVYEATWNLVPPMVLGVAVLPWVRRLQRARAPLRAQLLAHGVGALAFASAWQGVDYGLARGLFGVDHALATFQQRVLWRTAWAVFIYTALVLGFGGALHARRAHRAALAAAQAEAALVRAELAAITAKLNPHFLFNTLNSIVLLTRKDAKAAEQALLRFSRMLRSLLDSARGAADRVALRDELDFVRDYLALEALRLGPRLRVEWAIEPGSDAAEIPPLTIQPLVENAIVHGIAPRPDGGTVRIESRRLPQHGGLLVRVADDGAGCSWPPVERRGRTGVGLSALQRRFALDYEGRAHLTVVTAPGAGFQVEIVVPQPDSEP